MKTAAVSSAVLLMLTGCTPVVGPETLREGCNFLDGAYERALERVNQNDDWLISELYGEYIQELDEARQFTVLSELKGPIEDYLVALGDVEVSWQMAFGFFSSQDEARDFFYSNPTFQGYEQELSRTNQNFFIALEELCKA